MAYDDEFDDAWDDVDFSGNSNDGARFGCAFGFAALAVDPVPLLFELVTGRSAFEGMEPATDVPGTLTSIAASLGLTFCVWLLYRRHFGYYYSATPHKILTLSFP